MSAELIRSKNHLKFLLANTLVLLGLVLFGNSAAVADSQILGARLWTGEGKQQFVFDVSRHVKYKMFKLENPHRLVLDVYNTQLRSPLPKFNLRNTDVIKVRTGAPRKSVSRIVFDLDLPVDWKVTSLNESGRYGKRLMVELFRKETFAKAKSRPKPPPITKPRLQEELVSSFPSYPARDIVVALDAGHGGKDPGAIGHRGTLEKDIVLAIAREVQREMNKTKGLKAVMVRDGDYFIHLKKRRDIARKKYNADVFISIHADSFKNKKAKGASVFTLSQNGASSAAASYLADKENKADFIGGYNPENHSDNLSEAILTVALDGVRAESSRVGESVLKEIGGVSRLHKRHVEHAGFVVLKNPDMLSILVETGFISNPGEEKNLRKKSHQKKVANAIVSGTNRYFNEHPIPGTYYALKRDQQRYKQQLAKYVVTKGDTLSGIASRYQVSMDNLKRLNAIRSDRLHIGKVLLIPKA